MNTQTNAHKAALAGFLLVLPFFLMNTIVSMHLEPFMSWLRPGGHTNQYEQALLAFLMILFPIALFVTVRPLLKQEDGTRNFFLANAMLGAIIFALMIVLWSGLSADYIQCDVLNIPNCD